MRETKIKINQIDYDFEEHGGGAKSVELLSITTAPQPPFPAESRYYNSDENVIYKAIVDNTWENAETFNPEVGVLYTYDNETYLYDGKLNSLFKIGDSTSSSELFIVNKTLPVNTVILDTEIDFSENFLINVYVNGLLQTRDEHYYVENTNIVFTSPYPDEMNVIILYTNSSSVSLRPGNPSETTNYNSLANKPQINGVTLSGNKTSSELGIESGSELNEFIITEEIFNEYKDENNRTDLALLIQQKEITNKKINLNNYSYFLKNLSLIDNSLVFKNGQIYFDNIDNAITASATTNSFIGFKDCEIMNDKFSGDNVIIDLTNYNLFLDNVTAPELKLSSNKLFIKISGTSNVKINNSIFKFDNRSYKNPADETIITDPIDFTFIRFLNDNSSFQFLNSQIVVRNFIWDEIIDRFEGNPRGIYDYVTTRDSRNNFLLTDNLVTTKIDILNSEIDMGLTWGHHFHSINILNINLDNIDTCIVNSVLKNTSIIRNESKYVLATNKEFNISHDVHNNPSYMITIKDKGVFSIDEGPDEEPLPPEESTFDFVKLDEDVFNNNINPKQKLKEDDIYKYLFIYDIDTELWNISTNLNEEEIIDTANRNKLESKYGITYELMNDKSLEDGTLIKIYYDYEEGYDSYQVLRNFRAQDDTEEYIYTLLYPFEEYNIKGEKNVYIEPDSPIESVSCNINALFGETLDRIIEIDNGIDNINADIYLKFEYKRVEDEDEDEDSNEYQDPSEEYSWYMSVVRREENTPHGEEGWEDVYEYLKDIKIDLESLALVLTLKDGQELTEGARFKIYMDPYVNGIVLCIKKFLNSTTNSSDIGGSTNYFMQLFDNSEATIFNNIKTDIIDAFELASESVDTNRLSASDYDLPIENENLEADNVRDAINELADNKQNKPQIFINIEASDWQEDNTFEDYGYKCEIECEGVNENMFAQVIFGLTEAESGNYARVCETDSETVTIYSKVNDSIIIPTIIVMEA